MAAIELKVMKAIQDHWRNPFVHAYLWMIDGAEQHWVVEGYPEKHQEVEYLQAWIYPGDQGHYGLSLARFQQRIWTCPDATASQVQQVLDAARAFPRLTVRYRMLRGPNSNTFLRYVAAVAGLDLPRPDFAVAWETEILGR